VGGQLGRPLGGPVVVAAAATPWSVVSRSPARRAMAGRASTTTTATSSQTAQTTGFQAASPDGNGTTLR
jgi:hypothetical protein